MKILVVYDSMYGNTARVAGAVGDALRPRAEVRVMPVAEATPDALGEADMLFVGSPTQRFRPLPSVSSRLRELARGSLRNVGVAAFDTRIQVEAAHSAVLSFFVRLFGPSAYAVRHIERALRRAGGTLVLPGEGFFVDGTEGPLKEGELERAGQWARDAMARAYARTAAAGPVAASAEQPGGPRRGAAQGADDRGGRGPGRRAPN